MDLEEKTYRGVEWVSVHVRESGVVLVLITPCPHRLVTGRHAGILLVGALGGEDMRRQDKQRDIRKMY